MRKINFLPNHYYHLYGRGVAKQPIFLDKRDWARFLFLILYLQTPEKINHIGKVVKRYVEKGKFNISEETLSKILQNRDVELLVFTLMPNHFHLLAMEKKEGGISAYMHRVLTAYSMYFNKKYERSGHVFQGPFQARVILSDAQLNITSAYIHRNQREIKKWKNREDKYPWSSFIDYSKDSRWGKLLCQDVLLEQFGNKKRYTDFVLDTMIDKEDILDGLKD